MLGPIKQFIGRNSPEIVWISSVNAVPRAGTVNAQQFDHPRMFCCIRTPLREGEAIKFVPQPKLQAVLRQA